MKYIKVFACFLLFSVSNTYAQSEQKEIKDVIDQLFEGMRKADSAMVHRAFDDQVIMQSISMTADGKTALNKSSLESFLKAVGTPHEEVWNEVVTNYEIRVDGSLASAWTPYKFYRGENFSHCGVNSFQLAKLNGQWKIIFLIDTRRREGCQ